MQEMPQSLQELVTGRDALGASRLRINKCFEPERVVTLTFGAERIGVEVFGPREREEEAGSVHYDNAPEWVRSWDDFLRFTSPLESCRNLVYDGTSYTHALFGSGRDDAITCIAPNWRENPRHMTVIRGYVELAEAAGLRRLIRMWRWSS